MGKTIKIILTVLVAGFVCFGLFIYFSLAGTPWGKIYHKYQLKDYLANKYDEEMVITKSIYNFKTGDYGVRAYPKATPEIKFSAWQHYDQAKRYRDYYPEALWENEINSDFEGVLGELYPDAESKGFHGVTGVSDGMNINKEIPHYSEVEIPFFLVIRINNKLTEDMKHDEVERLYGLIEELKEKEIFVSILVAYRDKQDDTKNSEKYINFDMKESKEYPNKEEIKIIFAEELEKEIIK